MSINLGARAGLLRSARRERSWAGALLGAWGGIALVAGCGGGSEKAARGPEAAKVVWGGGEAASESEASAEAPAEPAAVSKKAEAAPKKKEAPPAVDSEEAEALAEGAIDLDAPAAAAPAPAVVAPSEAKPPKKGSKAAAREAKAAKAKAAQERATKERATAKEAKVAEEAPEPAPEAPAAEPSPDAPPPLAELQRRRNEREKTETKEKKPSEKKAEAEPAEPAAPAYKGAEPCRAASFTIDRVRNACESGGRPGAKRVMKEAINKAVATGQLLKCGDCHASTSEYTLKSDAVEKLQRWLAR